jgi:bifunctional DNA-binding transcriptional regulator/antitoxin component of YhaV-PrlF toxin-antitoxin module
MTQDEMERLTAHTEVKSEKIRILFKAGVERADIARFIDISYQHVQNVLKRSKLIGKAAASQEGSADNQVYTVTVEAGGRITLPAGYAEKQNITEGEMLICREEAGGLTIMSREAAAHVLREVAKQRMPGEAALLEALLADRSRPT